MTDDSGSRNAVVIERSFDAPVDLIWKMNVSVGGTRLVCMEMRSPDGTMQMWFAGEYREVIENERLVYSEYISDENGNMVSPTEMGMPDGHPMVTEVRVELQDVGGSTRMVMTHSGIPAGSPGAAGWTMAFAKLAAYINTHNNRSRR